ncbi:hypothetical protein BGZ98_001529 [Dissophora globulifera]|nr:hypothetical protein BGZ98_001529 [Dissophora globulifera]
MAHVRQDSSSTFYTLTPNASNVDLSIASSFTNLSSVDLSSLSTSDPASTSGLASHTLDPSPASSAINNPNPPFKAIKNSKSPLALRRSSTISSTGSPSPSNTFPSKGSFPKLSLSSNATHNTKTLTQERQKIILEILQTERSYVDGLVILQTLFYEPLNAPYATNNNSGMNTTTSTSFGNIHGLSAGTGAGAGTGGTQSSLNTSTYASSTVGSSSTLAASAAPLLTKKSVAEIFSNFSEILQINTLLLTQLETRICGATFSTGWESDDEVEESNENTHHGQHKDGSRGSQERRGAEQMPSQVLVTVGGQGGEQEQLLVLDTDWLIGDIFIEIAPFLKMYSNYVKTYTSALTHINDCMNRNDRFTEFLKATAKKPECRNLDFQAYLMLPVQRIPRYRMLLESLLRHTPDDHPDHRKLQTAFESMEQTANFVNETIRQHEMFGEMLDLQSRITGFSEPLVVPGRVLLKRGNVWKVCRRNVQPRMIILLSDCILWTSPGMNPLDGTLTFHRKVGLENCTVIGAEDPDPTKNAFQIISPEKSSQVYVDTPKEKEDWMVAIRRATQEYLSAKRTLKISITPMQSISAAATSFGANLLRRDNRLWSPSPFGGGSDSRSNTFISSPTSASPETQNSATGAWSSLGGGYYQAGPGAATAGTAQKSQQQPLHVVENYNAPVWVPDHSAMRCMICTEEFGTIFRRKHHCRACGKVVCHSCSTRTILIKSAQSEKVGRACDDCIDTMFPEEADTTANQALAPVPEPVSGGRGAHGDPHRRANSQSLDGVLVRPEDYSQEYGVQSGATGLVRGFVEAGLNRMKSRHGQVEFTAAESNARENTRESNRRSDSHFASAYDNSVKECGLCRTEFSMFKWRNICSKCRRVVCSDCLTKKQIDQLFLLGLQAESEGLESESEIAVGQMSHGRQPSDAQELSRPGLSQNVSESAVETSRQSDIAGSLSTRRSQSFNQGDGGVANNGSGGYGSFGHGWRAIKGNTDSGHGHAEKLCDPCYLGLSDDHIKVLETGGGWHYYQATLGKHQAPALVAALAMSAMTLGEDGDNEEGSADGAAKLAPNKSETGIALRRAG